MIKWEWWEIVVSKIKILGKDSNSVRFEYRDGALSGKYTFRRDGDPLNSVYNTDGMALPTSSSQHIVAGLLKEGVIE